MEPVKDNYETINLNVTNLLLIVLDKLKESNIGSSPTNPSAAVDQYGAWVVQQNFFSMIKQIQESLRILWSLHVRPVYAVELFHCALLTLTQNNSQT